MNQWLEHPVIPKDAVTFTVPGKPVPKERPRFARGKVYTPRKTAAYENTVGYAGLAAMVGRELLKGPLWSFLVFKIPIPKGTTEHSQALMLDLKRLPCTGADKDNLEKAISDALNGIVYEDDAQICGGTQYKIYSNEPGVEVAVWEMGEVK